MTVIELRDRLNQLVNEGKSDMNVLFDDGASGLVEIFGVREDSNTWDGKYISLR